MDDKEKELILNNCSNCVKLNMQTFKCFALNTLFFKKNYIVCKAKEIDIYRWDRTLESMVNYYEKHLIPVPRDLQEEIRRVKKIKDKVLTAEISQAYYSDTHPDNIKFGGRSDHEAPVSIKQKMKDNRLVISFEERERDRKKLERIISRGRRMIKPPRL